MINASSAHRAQIETVTPPNTHYQQQANSASSPLSSSPPSPLLHPAAPPSFSTHPATQLPPLPPLFPPQIPPIFFAPKPPATRPATTLVPLATTLVRRAPFCCGPCYLEIADTLLLFLGRIRAAAVIHRILLHNHRIFRPRAWVVRALSVGCGVCGGGCVGAYHI